MYHRFLKIQKVETSANCLPKLDLPCNEEATFKVAVSAKKSPIFTWTSHTNRYFMKLFIQDSIYRRPRNSLAFYEKFEDWLDAKIDSIENGY